MRSVCMRTAQSAYFRFVVVYRREANPRFLAADTLHRCLGLRKRTSNLLRPVLTSSTETS
jgi:hypothetical protein